jgi:signal transduction histidine kinase
MGLRDWLRPPRYTLPLFLAVTLGPAIALIWLGWRLLDVDRASARQQVRDRLEYAADLIANGLDRELEGLIDRLPALLESSDAMLSQNGALVVALIPAGVEARAGAPLLYAPAATAAGDPPPSTWVPAEEYEFQEGAYLKAATAFRELARSSDPRIRAGALVRLARSLRKANKPDEALNAYATLADLADVAVGGEPAPLVARQARCRLLHDLGRLAESRPEAEGVLADLERGRWLLERASFLFHQQQAERCGGDSPRALSAGGRDARALAAAIDILWRDWRDTGRLQKQWRGRRSAWIDDRSVLLLWNGSPDTLLAFAASPRYIDAQWQRLWTDQRTRLTLVDGDGHRVLGGTGAANGQEAARIATDTKLPWTLRVASAALDSELGGIARRRRLLLTSLGLVAFLVLTGSYFVARAIQKELAVARLQSDFVSAVSHEFRTPLTSMRHMTELLKDGQIASDDRRQQYYDVLAHETDRLHRFVETLLNFGRMDAGAEQYRFEQEEPASLVQQIVDEFRSDRASLGRRIDVIPNGGLPPVWIDREAFARALWNLLENAAKYSAEDTPIDVELGSDGQRIAISVRDRGPGIPAAEHQRIFQKFVRGAETRASGVKGTGVGLAIVSHVVRAHGGDVRLTSAVGRGSTFTMLIPTAERQP